jgi:hypothetical protein
MKTIVGMIKERLAKKDMNPSQLARLCGTTEQNMIKKLKKHDMDTAWVARISVAMEHDFFAELSREWVNQNKDIARVSDIPTTYGKNPLEDYIKQLVRDAVAGEKKSKVSYMRESLQMTSNGN